MRGEGEDDEELTAWSRANKSAADFLGKISWYPDVAKFLDACRYIGEHADPHEGVVFIDPLDEVPVRWHDPERTVIRIPVGDDMKLLVEAPGRDGVLAVAKNGLYPVDAKKLRRRVAPCVTHITDAFYSSLVIEHLVARGITNFVAIHDCSLVPTDGETLTDILNDAPKDWRRGLGPVYTEHPGP